MFKKNPTARLAKKADILHRTLVLNGFTDSRARDLTYEFIRINLKAAS